MNETILIYKRQYCNAADNDEDKYDASKLVQHEEVVSFTNNQTPKNTEH